MKTDTAVTLKLLTMSLSGKQLSEEDIVKEIESTRQALNPQLRIEQSTKTQQDTDTPGTDGERSQGQGPKPRSASPELVPQDLDTRQPVAEYRIVDIPLSTAPYVQPLRQKIKTFEKLGSLGFWTSTTSWKRPFFLIPSKNHFLIFATPYRRCFPPPCNPWGPPKTKIGRLQTKKSGVIKRLHSIISGSCRLQILWRLHMRVARSCCPPFAMLAFFSSTHVRRR